MWICKHVWLCVSLYFYLHHYSFCHYLYSLIAFICATYFEINIYITLPSIWLIMYCFINGFLHQIISTSRSRIFSVQLLFSPSLSYWILKLTSSIFFSFSFFLGVLHFHSYSRMLSSLESAKLKKNGKKTKRKYYNPLEGTQKSLDQ